jgi:hypothetical protein
VEIASRLGGDRFAIGWRRLRRLVEFFFHTFSEAHPLKTGRRQFPQKNIAHFNFFSQFAFLFYLKYLIMKNTAHRTPHTYRTFRFSLPCTISAFFTVLR